MCCTGGSGDDLIFGGAGNDRLYGGPGHDLLIGGAGRDRATAGTSRDLCDTESATRAGGPQRSPVSTQSLIGEAGGRAQRGQGPCAAPMGASREPGSGLGSRRAGRRSPSPRLGEELRRPLRDTDRMVPSPVTESSGAVLEAGR